MTGPTLHAILGVLGRGQHWREQAACRINNRWQLFDRPHDDEKPPTRGGLLPRHRQAIAICREECPVIIQCRHWALTESEDEEAVLGGLSGQARTDIRSRHGFYQPHHRECNHGIPADDYCGLCARNARRRVTTG